MAADPDDPTPRPAISRARVIEAAIEVIDERGVEGLTMRRLGAALSADPMAAYLHVRTKAELLDAVVAHEITRLADWPPLDLADPVEAMIQLALHYRSILLEHPKLAPLIASRPLEGAAAADTVVAGIVLLEQAGFHPETIPVAWDSLVTFAFGFVLQEALRVERRAVPTVSYLDQQTDILQHLLQRDGDTAIAEAIVARRLRPGAHEDEFTVGLRALMRGLAAGLGTGPTTPAVDTPPST